MCRIDDLAAGLLIGSMSVVSEWQFVPYQLLF